MRYVAMGDLPPKRHTQFRDDDGRLLVEEVMGYEGFSGNESILYHLRSPCDVAEVGAFEPIALDEWVPDAHVHRLTDTTPLGAGGDPVFGRRVLMFNDDVEIAICKPAEELDAFYRNGEGDEVLFVHDGSGAVETIFGTLPYARHDYVVIPRGTTYRVRMDGGAQTWLTFHTPGEIETPNRYRNRYGQLLEHAPFSQRDFHPPAELAARRERGSYELVVRARRGFQRFVLDHHPLDVVGWDGYVYPYTFNIHDFEPKSGRLHQPPTVHQTFQGPNFVICSFCPRNLDWDPLAVALPYHHSNLQSEEVIYYVDGRFGSRAGVDVGALTLHPSGLSHGPQPGLVERSLGATRTEELAVMCDTFRPLRLTTLARELDDPSYALSWHESARAPVGERPGVEVLPWGVVRPRGVARALPAVRAGEDAVVLATLAADGLLEADPDLVHALQEPNLNALIELGSPAWSALRERLRELVAADAIPAGARVPLSTCETVRPVRVTDFVDFFASLEHATNLGRLFRPGRPELPDNWRHMPVGYHGRASTVLASGSPVRRPRGQIAAGRLAPTRALDLECELGYVCGPTVSGPIAIDRADEHLFGVVIVNDWSARDVQRFEYQPLGPFLGKSFATSMSAWVTPLEALADARVAPRPQDPEPASYLRARRPWILDVALEVEVNGEVISRPPACGLYWTPAQMLAHLTVNGATLTAGDLVASGTISGAGPGTEGSLAELWRGERWLQDGDEVVLRGRAGTVELGEVRGRVVAS